MHAKAPMSERIAVEVHGFVDAIDFVLISRAVEANMHIVAQNCLKEFQLAGINASKVTCFELFDFFDVKKSLHVFFH